MPPPPPQLHMLIKSHFDPLPPVPVTNAHNVLFRDLGIADYDLFIDGLTGQRVTKLGFKQRVLDLATAFTAPRRVGGLHFVPNEDVIGLLAPNSIDFCTVVHAAFVATVPIALFPSGSTAHELAYLFKRSKATRLFVQSSHLRIALAAIDKSGFARDRVYLVDQAGGRPSVESLVENVVRKNLPRESPRAVHASTLGYMIFSSGTSGTPKAVMITHVNMIASFMSLAAFGEELQRSLAAAGVPSRDDLAAVTANTNDLTSFLLSGEVTADSIEQQRVLAVLPFYHSYGLHSYVLRGIAVPQTMVILPRFDVNLVLDMIPKYRIEMMGMVPSMVHQFLNSPRLPFADLSSLRSVGTGAAYLPPTLSHKLQTVIKSKTILPEGYGLSEVTVGAIFRPPVPFFGGRLPVNPLSTGILLPGLEARIVRSVTHAPPKPGQKVGDIVNVVDAVLDEPGELWLRGTVVAQGYFGDEQATREAFLPGGWLRTGDRFRVDAQGYFFYEDRVKDTLKVGGVQVSPAEIESCIMEVPGGIVADVSVIGVQPPTTRLGKDEKWPRAYVVLTAKGSALGEKEAAATISDWVRTHLNRSKRLRGGITFVEQIPKSPTGKVLRRELQDQYALEQAGRSPRKVKAKL
ncbi:acetyl-CoA synthetase-like protein [Exidia glandulosa HHB12029]|uniref:Acetyl-CoA synthetase-like protein n=1 Tax=Exidia glandulosa HHB12029 TaxID=1314781 RepID=A0A165QB63_EXIGL|nr:acetyl-CoA synthetase-like protein [Exidia glandulosa HHB12029]